MANSRTSEDNREYATVDTAPGGEGYFTNVVDIAALRKRKGGISKLYFSIRETIAQTSVITVVLQFRCLGIDIWQDYVPQDGSTLAIGNRIIIADSGSAVSWRAGVKPVGYTSGSLTFGFDW